MGLYNRYYIAKKKHQEYLIIIIKKEKYVSCGIDALILKRLKKNTNIEHQLQKLHVNYLILDNLDIINIYTDENNEYNKYFYIEAIIKILNKLQGKYLENPEFQQLEQCVQCE